MKRKSHAGITSMMLPVFVQDTSSAIGAGLGGIAFNTSGLVGEYRRQGQSSWTAITLAAGTLGTWSSGGWIADGALGGAYEVGIPDAAVASGARWVAVRYRGATNMLPVLVEIELDAVDYQDATAFGLADLDAAISSRSTYAGTDTAGTTTLLGRLTATRAGLLDNLDAAISTRSTYAGGDTAGTTTLLARLSATRAANLDNLDAAVSSRSTYAGGAVASVTAAVAVGSIATDAISAASVSAAAVTKIQAGLSTYAGGDTAGTTTLLTRLTSGRATNLDNLDAAVSTRLATSGYTAPPTAADIVTAAWTDLLSGSDFATAGSIGKLLKDDVDAAISSRSAYAGGDTAGTTTLLGRLTSGRATGLDNLDAAISTRSTFAGGAVASVTAGVTVTTVNDKAGYSLGATGLDAIPTTAPTGVAANFREMMVQVWRRIFAKSVKDVGTHTITTFADNGMTVITTQPFTDDGAGNETLGAAT